MDVTDVVADEGAEDMEDDVIDDDTATADATGDALGDRTCDRCDGQAVPVASGGLTLLECADCGNVLGLVDEEGPVVEEQVEGLDTVDGEDGPVEEVTARDGAMGQLVALLRAGDAGTLASTGPVPSIETDRLLVETDRATLEVVAADDRLLIRESDRDEGRDGDDRDGAD